MRRRRQRERWQSLLRVALLMVLLVGATGSAYAGGHPRPASTPGPSQAGVAQQETAAADLSSIATTSAGDQATGAPPAAATSVATSTVSIASPLPSSGASAPSVELGPLNGTIVAVELHPLVGRAESATTRPRPTATPSPTAIPVPSLDQMGLSNALTALVRAADGTYAVSVIDLASNQRVDLDATSSMDAASVNKLEILAALYHQVELGRLSLDQTVRTGADDIQDYGTGVIRYQPVGTTYTLNDLARLLVEQSDNTASFMLAQIVGLPTVDALVQQWGLPQTRVGELTSSAHDAATLMALLYHGRLANPAHTKQMVEYLSHTAWNDRIPAGVPASVTVAHKIGNQVNVVNDVGIVYLPGRPYVLSIFSADVNEDQAVGVEQAISRTVYDFEREANGNT